uniref:Uncharacterized protein n=1 Tax=Anopheles atroparvus TaxID=41427 RepID=A0A182J5S6_ANOAO
LRSATCGVFAMDAAGDGDKKSAVATESFPEGGECFPATEKGVRIGLTDSPPVEGSILPEQPDDASLNPQLLDQLNEQFAKQVQLAVNEGMDDTFKIAIYNDWVHSLRSLNTELVQSLREMQDTCMERMALMRAAYLKDLVRFGPDIRLKRLDNMSAALSSVTPAPGEEIVALELSSNYPIVPTTDQMLLQELDSKTRQIEQLRKELSDRCSMVDQLRNMNQEREKQLDDKRKEIDIMRQQISLLDGQLLKAKLSAAATTDNRSLISEITDHHDKITQLKKKLKEQEDKLRQANTAIHFRDEVIAQQRHEIKLLHENVTPHSVADVETLKQPERVHFSTPETQAISSSSFHSIVSDGSVSNFTGSAQPLLEGIDTIQKHSETETEYVRTLQQELSELRAQLHDKRVHGSIHRSSELTALNGGGEWDRADTGKALLGLRGACEELLQTTARVCGAGEALGGCHDESGTLRYEDDDELIEAMRACGEMLCRRLTELPAACALEQDEGIGSATVSRLEDCSDVAVQRELHAEAVVCQLVEQLKRLLGKDSNNSASQSLSSLSLGLDEGCTLQGLIDDLKKEIETKDLVLRDRHGELERLHQELASRERQLDQCRARQETIDGEKITLQKKIAGLEETADDQGRVIAMLNMEKSKLVQQVEDLKETLQQYRDNLQQTSEEKVAIEDECKNQLVTISNLRVALEETKRNSSSSVSFFSGLRYSQSPSTTSSPLPSHAAHRIGHHSYWPSGTGSGKCSS